MTWRLPFLCLLLSILLFITEFGLGHRCPHINANQTAAIATLRNIRSAQEQFRGTAMADQDGDGKGEYGGFRELSGSAFVRGRDRPLCPPVLSGAFRTMIDDGFVVRRSGYRFVIYLPGDGGIAVREIGPAAPRADAREFGDEHGESTYTVRAAACVVYGRPIDPDLAENTWCVYAWPDPRLKNSTHTYFICGSSEDVLGTEDGEYEATEGPKPGAAFLTGGLEFINGAPATGTTGQDGSRWRVIR